MSLKKFSKEELGEMSLLEMAYELLVDKNAPVAFDDFVKELAALKGLTKAQIKSRIPQLYTDLNVDGRFTCLGENRWGLKTWYPVDQIEDEVVHHVAKPKKKKSKKATVVEELDEEDLDFEEELDEDEDDLLDDSIDDIDDDLVEDDDDDEEDSDEGLIDDDEEEEEEKE